MTWKPYPAYRNSGIQWVGKIPEHWDTIPLWTTLLRNDGGVWGNDCGNGGTVVLRSTEQTVDGKWKIDAPARRDLSTSDKASALLAKGDLVITKSSGSELHIGKTTLVTDEIEALACCFSNFMQRLRVGDRCVPGFIYYVLNSLIGREQMVWNSNTTTGLANLTGEIISHISVPFPSVSEQRAITAFLDHKIEHIDKFVAKKEQQLELLQEKRFALLTYAVTNGLHPDVRMKDSGVEWLGKIPEHWEINKIKYVGKIKYGLGQPPRELEEGLPLIRATDISSGKINLNSILRVDPDDIPWTREPALRAKDIIVVRSGAYTGDSAIIPLELAGSIAGYDLVLTVTEAVPEFVSYALLSKYLLQGQMYLEKMRAAQPHLNAEQLGDCLILIPPRLEQEEISSYLDQETKKLDGISYKIHQSVTYLHEYRMAFISAAVTGKIDIRQEMT